MDIIRKTQNLPVVPRHHETLQPGVVGEEGLVPGLNLVLADLQHLQVPHGLKVEVLEGVDQAGQ